MRSFHVLLPLAFLAGATGVLQAGLIDPDYDTPPRVSGRGELYKPTDDNRNPHVETPMPGFVHPPSDNDIPNGDIPNKVTMNYRLMEKPDNVFFFDIKFKVDNIPKGTSEYLFTANVINKTGLKLTTYGFLLGFGLGAIPSGAGFKPSNDRDYLDFDQPFDKNRKLPNPKPNSTVFQNDKDHLKAGNPDDFLHWDGDATHFVKKDQVVTFTFPVDIPNAIDNHQMPESELIRDHDTHRITGYYFTLRATFTTEPIASAGATNPEPASAVLFGIGLIGMAGLVYYSRKREKQEAQS